MLGRVSSILEANIDLLIGQWTAALHERPDVHATDERFAREVQEAVRQLLHDLSRRLISTTNEHDTGWHEAVQRAQRLGKLRQQQGSRLHEVMEEYLVLRETVWGLYRERLRREDGPFIQFVALLNEGIDALLLATAEAFYRAHAEDLERWAATDSLTGLLNRRYFFERLREEFLRSQRGGQEFSILMLDLNEFKRFNDHYGHQAGDTVLTSIAQAIRRTIRSHDVFARYGGDEFIILLPQSHLDPRELAKRIVRAVDSVSIEGIDGGVAGAPTHVGVSVGVARFPQDAQDVDALVAVADAALYRAKRNRSHISGGRASGPEAANGA